MPYRLSAKLGVIILVTQLTVGCDKLGIGSAGSAASAAPSEQELQKIAYMSTQPGPGGRKVYSHYEDAHDCADYELAMRWNRPPGVAGGPFSKKMIYLDSGMPATLSKDSEVFLKAVIVKGETLSSGSAGWILRMPDGSLAQAVEMANFLQKEDQDPAGGKPVAFSSPNKPGRAFCGQGVYEGANGKNPDDGAKIPLFSMIFAMDRQH